MRKSLVTLLPGFSLVFGTMLVGCNPSATEQTAEQVSQKTSTTGTPPKTDNQVCPIMGGSVASDGGTAEWNGKLIGFCCPECIPKWEKLSEDQKTEKLVAVNSNAEGDDSATKHDHQ